MMPQFMAQQPTMVELEQLSAEELEFWSSLGVDVQSSNFAEQELWSSNGVDSNGVVPHISDFLGFQSTSSTNAEHCQELEQQVLGTEEEQQVLMSQLMGQQSTMAETEQLSAGELESWSSIGVDVQSSNFAEQELWSSNGIESNGMVPHISDFLGSPSVASANAEQCQELEQQMLSAEEEQVMVPQLMGQQFSMPEQLPGELGWSSIGVNVQSNNFAEQDSWGLTGFESNSMVPHVGNMAGDHHDQQDFWSLSRADIRSNCAVLDMAAGALVGTQWGGYSITC
ncbi:unnamed protein product [Urochloa humidicola]